jgi:peroxiredoxin
LILLLRCVRRHLGVLLLGSIVVLGSAAVARSDALEVWRPVTVPNFTLPALDGTTAHLGAEAGKLVIVHFFATWCEPCRDELKSLERLAESLVARPLRILAVDVGEPADRVRRFLERNKISLPFPVLVDFDKQVMRAWQVEMLPTSFVLDRTLCPLWKIAGALEWDVGSTLSMIEAEIARSEQSEGRTNQANCIVKGGTQ